VEQLTRVEPSSGERWWKQTGQIGPLTSSKGDTGGTARWSKREWRRRRKGRRSDARGRQWRGGARDSDIGCCARLLLSGGKANENEQEGTAGAAVA
jgi:hypothetical protein